MAISNSIHFPVFHLTFGLKIIWVLLSLHAFQSPPFVSVVTVLIVFMLARLYSDRERNTLTALGGNAGGGALLERDLGDKMRSVVGNLLTA